MAQPVSKSRSERPCPTRMRISSASPFARSSASLANDGIGSNTICTGPGLARASGPAAFNASTFIFPRCRTIQQLNGVVLSSRTVAYYASLEPAIEGTSLVCQSRAVPSAEADATSTSESLSLRQSAPSIPPRCPSISCIPIALCSFGTHVDSASIEAKCKGGQARLYYR